MIFVERRGRYCACVGWGGWANEGKESESSHAPPRSSSSVHELDTLHIGWETPSIDRRAGASLRLAHVASAQFTGCQSRAIQSMIFIYSVHSIQEIFGRTSEDHNTIRRAVYRGPVGGNGDTEENFLIWNLAVMTRSGQNRVRGIRRPIRTQK